MHINFSEILVVLLVALLVIKPEQLPSVAYTLGRWLKQARQAVLHVKSELNGETPPKKLPESSNE